MAAENIIPELSWLCAVLFLAIIIVMIVTCVCFKDNEKPQEYGTAGRLSITRDSPVIHFQPKAGGTLSISSRNSDLSSDDGIPKRNSWTVKDRALPEIPDCGSSSLSLPENGIHVNNIKVMSEQPVKGKSHNKAMAPKPPGSDPSKVFPVNGPALLSSEGPSVHSVTITVNDKSHAIGNNISSLDIGAEPCLPVAESIPGTSSNMVVLKKMEKKESNELSDKTSSRIVNVYDIVGDHTNDRSSQTGSVSSSPVCIKVEGSSSVLNPAPEEEASGSSPSASLAVAGAVPSSDIPYMTPPLLPNPSMAEENDAAGGRSEVPYTVISVREPLARVREITMRKQRAVAVQQNSEESEDHYAMVPEEEQMYAEIGSGQDSGSSSITYAHIEPRELPPVPPTVESLKSVAHAHSRQASTVSTCSFTSNISSSGEPASPSILANPSTSLYSTVEKNNKQRKTIHLGEGVSVVTATAEKRKKVEDLYAKVRKKRVNLTISTSGSEDYSTYQGICDDEDVECITPPPSPWASTTPPAPPPIAGRLQAATLSVLLPGSSHHVRRHSADPNLPEVISDNRVFSNSSRSSLVMPNTSEEPGYERIYNEENNSGDSCYEKIQDETLPNGYQNQVHPGYESVKDEDDPGYESVAQAARESEPGYELVRSFDDSDSNSDYTAVKLDEIKESGYEVVKNLARSGSDAADPGYEKIKKVPRTDSDATDPGYERVKNKGMDAADPGYETVQRSDSDTDPCYEIVHSNNTPTVEYGEENTPSVTHNANSTILFVSGNSSEIRTLHGDPQTRSHTIISESNLTFL